MSSALAYAGTVPCTGDQRRHTRLLASMLLKYIYINNYNSWYDDKCCKRDSDNIQWISGLALLEEGPFQLQIRGSEGRGFLTEEMNQNEHRSRKVQDVSETEPHSSSDVTGTCLRGPKIVLEADFLFHDIFFKTIFPRFMIPS